MSSSAFASFIFAVMTFWLVIALQARDVFDEGKFIALEKAQVERNVKQAELEKKVLADEFFNYRQQIVAQFPKIQRPASKGDWLKQGLLEVSRLPASEASNLSSDLILSNGKHFFNAKNYSKAVAHFSRYLEFFPAGAGSLEARFLRAESYFLNSQLDAAVVEIESMIDFFPEYTGTGYLMLRLSQIYQLRKLTAEALEVLKMIDVNFSYDANLMTQVHGLRGQIENANRP
jgi:TolA-binding protein